VKDLKIVPGMPVEVLCSDWHGSALSYSLKPLMDPVMRTFRET
jgi:hypothetical protein